LAQIWAESANFEHSANLPSMPGCRLSCRANEEIPAEESMLAACYHKHGDPAKVVHVEKVRRPPAPNPGQLLVRVRAASLNPADWKSGKGEQAALLKFAWPRVYGFDFSGEVVAVGGRLDEDKQDFCVGDDVFGMIRGLPQLNRGTLAEFVLVESAICAKRPLSVPHGDCASVPLVGITAVKMLRSCGLVEQPPSPTGPRVFITGGAGGMGTIAIQIALKMFGASFVATTASPGSKTELCQRLGAARVVNYRDEDFSDVLASAKQEDLFDAILDCTGEAHRCVELLKTGGALVSILAGPTQEALTTWLEEARVDPSTVTVGVNRFVRSGWGGSIFQVFSGARKLRKKCEARGARYGHVIGTGSGEIMQKISGLLASGELQAVIDREFALSDALEAIQYQASGRAMGKVVVTIPEVSSQPIQTLSNTAEGSSQRSETTPITQIE